MKTEIKYFCIYKVWHDNKLICTIKKDKSSRPYYFWINKQYYDAKTLKEAKNIIENILQ